MIAASTVCKMHAAGTDFFRSSLIGGAGWVR